LPPADDTCSMDHAMLESLAAIESALATVQKLLDALNSRGDNEAAYELARAQFQASIRSSWPGNLGGLTKVLQATASNAALKLSEAEREQALQAAAVLRDAVNR